MFAKTQPTIFALTMWLHTQWQKYILQKMLIHNRFWPITSLSDSIGDWENQNGIDAFPHKPTIEKCGTSLVKCK